MSANILHTIPFWVWVIVPALLLALITYLLSKNLRNTVMVALLAIAAAWAAAGFHVWEVFLANHFLGYYDTHGLPQVLSAPGRHFLLVSWPLWLVPSLFACAIGGAVVWYFTAFHQWQAKRRIKREMKGKFKGKTNKDIIHQFEVRKLKSELQQQTDDLKQARVLIEKLLDKRLDVNQG